LQHFLGCQREEGRRGQRSHFLMAGRADG
jgi:hypothetical protein